MATAKTLKYDFIVVGTGSGSIISSEAASHGFKVAVIDKGPLIGGTCLNLGCIPSKQLITIADRVADIQEAGKFGIEAQINKIDFGLIMKRLRQSRQQSQEEIRDGLKNADNTTFYEGTAKFADKNTIEVNGKKLTADHIILATGSRPLVPPIKGLDKVKYLTNESAFELTKLPPSMIIIGGGYIAVEFGHFFAAMGTKVTMIEMADRLITSEEPEISALLQKELSGRMTIVIGSMVEEVGKSGSNVVVTVKNQKTGAKKKFTAAAVMLAGGRKSNADTLDLKKAGIEVNPRGFIQINEYMETNRKNIYAVGDANGTQMFTHMANRQASIVTDNLLHDTHYRIDFSFIPHAVFTRPQIASIGLKQADAEKQYKVDVGTAKYSSIAKGAALMEKDTFAKVIINRKNGKILGFHIIGPEAPELIQEVINAVNSGGKPDEIMGSIHIHPALSELIEDAIASA